VTAGQPPVPVAAAPVASVPLRSRRRQRALALQKAQHAVPAIGLLGVGLQALREGAHGPELALAAIEIAAGGVLLVAMARSLRAARTSAIRHAAHAGVDWIDIWAAAVLFVEALETWHLKGHIARPVILTALLTLAMGLFHGRIMQAAARRRMLEVSAEGIRIGGGPFRRFCARWSDIRSIDIDQRQASIHTHHGRPRRLALTDLDDAPAVRAALLTARTHLAERASTSTVT
jgi:PH (Pleckstrin Homology) domain-containing protein